MQDLEDNRLFILKRLGILRILSIIEAFIVAFLAFVLTKDLIICIVLAVFVGILFFRLTSKTLLQKKSMLELEITRLFLRQNQAKFKSLGIKEKDFATLSSLNFNDFKSLNSFEFKHFTVYDVFFKDEIKRAFCGIFIKSQKDVNKELNQDLEQIFTKIKVKKFDTNHLCCGDKWILIPTLRNPFFADLKLSVEKNLKIMQENLDKIKALFSLHSLQ